MSTKQYDVVIDTNVFVTALRSRRGASYKLLFETSRRKFRQNLSTPLALEYESAAKRTLCGILSDDEIDAILDMICALSVRCKIFYLWRPFLRDPKDDMVLELAVESQSQYIITYNKRHFKGIEQFGVEAITPKEFLTRIGELET